MQIRQLEGKTGLDRATIRYYEAQGFLAPTRKENGYREYADTDVQLLLKIKLLRQLGMSLEKIRALQQGSADMDQALQEQITLLEEKIQSAQRARDICQEARNARVTFRTLDAAYYLDRLNRPEEAKKPIYARPVPEFDRQQIRPWHPFRRMFARWMDYGLILLIIRLLVISLLRIRPVSQLLTTVLSFSSVFLMIPYSGLWLHLTGTTPGKWAMGIHLETIDGTRPTFRQAMDREVEVLKSGIGWNIPIYMHWRLYKSWAEYRDSLESDWDWNWEAQFVSIRKPFAAGIAAVCVAFAIISGLDALRPTHLGPVTLEEYADNYNFYGSLLELNSNMQPDGSFWQDPSGVIIYIGGEPQNPMNPCTYVTNAQGHLRELHYRQTYSGQDIWLKKPLESALQYAIAAQMSQLDCGRGELLELMRQIEDHAAKTAGELSCQGITITWALELDNCRPGNFYYEPIDPQKGSAVTVVFSIVYN